MSVVPAGTADGAHAGKWSYTKGAPSGLFDSGAKSCDTCHHTQKGLSTDNGTKVAKCSTCHLAPKDAKVPGMREMSLTKNPLHIRCIACHKAQKKGPTACTACHKKA